MNAEDVPEQVIIDALAAYLDRPQRVLLPEDYGEPYGRMGDALAVALAHPDAQTAQAETARSEGFTAGQRHELDKVQVGAARLPRSLGELLTGTPGDLRVDPDKRVDAAYQRGFTAGRATVASVPVESTLGTTEVELDDGELYAAELATQIAVRRHAEVAAEAVLEQTDLARRAFDAEKLTPAYVVRRDALFAAIAHAEARATIDPDGTADAAIVAGIPYWENVLTPAAEDAAPEVAIFIDWLGSYVAGHQGIESVKSTAPGRLRVIAVDPDQPEDERRPSGFDLMVSPAKG